MEVLYHKQHLKWQGLFVSRVPIIQLSKRI